MKPVKIQYILGVLLAWALTCGSLYAQQPATQPLITMQDAATANGNGTEIELSGGGGNAMFGAVGIQVTGTFDALITFEVTFDSSTWVAVLATNLNSGTQATTATAPGAYSVLFAGAARTRARISTYVSGSITVKGRLIPGLISRATAAGGGGTGTVTSVGWTGGIVSVATATTTPAFTIAGTSGGIPYFSGATTWATSAALAANALVIGGGAGVAPSTTTTGTGVLTFLGTPSSANLAAAVTDETGSGAAVFGTAPTIAGGSITGLTAFGIRSTGAAFDLTIASAEVFTAGRTLTLDLGNAARTLTLGGNATLNGGTHSGTNTGDQTTVSGNAGTATALQTARTIGGVSFDGTANITVASATGGFAVTTELTTPSTTFALANATATTINFAGAATTLNVGTSATVLNFGGGATAGEFRFLEPSGSGTNYSAFKSVAQGANITYSLPPTVGAAGTVLTDAAGDGVLTWAAGGGGAALSGITAAAGNATIANAANNIIWNWQLTGAESGFTFGETAASTGGGASDQHILQVTAASASTAIPLFVNNIGAGVSFRVDDASGDTTPFVVAADGKVGVGTATPAEALTVTTTTGNYGLLHTDGTRSVGTFADSGGGYVGTKTNHDLILFTNNSNSLTSPLLFRASNGSSEFRGTTSATTFGATTISGQGIAIMNMNNTTGKPYGIELGGFTGYAHTGIYGVMGDVAGNSTGDLVFASRATTGATTFTERWRMTGPTGSIAHVPAVTTGTGATAGYSIVANSLTTGNGVDISSSSVTTGNIAKITSTSTAAASSTLTGLNIAISGANGTTAQTVTGATISVTNTNATSGTNVGLTLTASGATTENRALNVTAGQVTIHSGTAAIPAIGLVPTLPNYGIYYSGGVNVSISGTSYFKAAQAGTSVGSGAYFGFSNAASADTGTVDLFLRRSAAANLAFGAADAAAPVAQTLSVQNVVGGTTDTAGAAWTFTGSRSTGTGAGGSLIFQTSPAAGSTASTQNALVTALTIDSKAHVIYGGSAPVVSGSCGTSPSVAGTDSAGKLTTGTVAPTSCTLTFSKAWGTAPSCFAQNETTANLVKAISTTTTVILSGTFVASDVVSYACIGY